MPRPAGFQNGLLLTCRQVWGRLVNLGYPKYICIVLYCHFEALQRVFTKHRSLIFLKISLSRFTIPPRKISNLLFPQVLQIEVENKIFPCHSCLLGLHSNVFAEMFASDPNPENWSKGVTTAFHGSKPDVVQFYLCQTYSPSYRLEDMSTRLMCADLPSRTVQDVIFETMELAHKLDNVHIQTVMSFYSCFNNQN